MCEQDHIVLIWLNGEVKRVKKSEGLPLVKEGKASWATLKDEFYVKLWERGVIDWKPEPTNSVLHQ